MARLPKILLLCLVLWLSAATISSAAGRTWSQVSSDTESLLRQSLSQYQQGDTAAAKRLIQEAYFGPFESEGMEASIRLNISANRAFEHEAQFREIKRLMSQGAPPAEVRVPIDKEAELLRQDAMQLDGSSKSPVAMFFNSLVIILREGLEAILVLGALTAYLVKSGNQAKVRTIHISALTALLASLVTAFVLRYVINVSGAGQENLEGITMLVAVAVLFLVSHWLLSKAQADKWNSYIRSKMTSSLSGGRNLALGATAFLAVYREGAETVLFYQALASGADRSTLSAIAAGFVVGSLLLVIVYIAIRFGSARIPLRPFFTVTGIFLYYLAFVFAGEGIKELQAGGAIGVSPVSGVPAIGLLGIYPSWQGIALQGLLVIMFAVGLLVQFTRKSAPEATT